MNHCILTTCTCGREYCIRCESGACPDCGKPCSIELKSSDPNEVDLHLFCFFRSLLNMFGPELCFEWKIETEGSRINIWMSQPGKEIYTSYDAAYPAEVRVNDTRRIIQQIVMF